MTLDSIQLNLNSQSITILKLVVAIIMFGVSLDLKVNDFKNSFLKPRTIIAGLLGQYLLFPALTILLIYIYQPQTSISLGLFLVALCPAGNLGNLYTDIARGNKAVSIGITSLTTFIALFSLPLGVSTLGTFIPGSLPLLTKIEINFFEIMESIVLILAVPTMIGMLFNSYYPTPAQKIKPIMGKISFLFLIIFIVGALAANFSAFAQSIHLIIFVVLIHNFISWLSSYLLSKLFKLNPYEFKGLTFPLMIKNTALGLAITIQFFQSLGGMAIIVAWWGVSQIICGLVLSLWWKKHSKRA